MRKNSSISCALTFLCVLCSVGGQPASAASAIEEAQALVKEGAFDSAANRLLPLVRAGDGQAAFEMRKLVRRTQVWRSHVEDVLAPLKMPDRHVEFLSLGIVYAFYVPDKGGPVLDLILKTVSDQELLICGNILPASLAMSGRYAEAEVLFKRIELVDDMKRLDLGLLSDTRRDRLIASYALAPNPTNRTEIMNLVASTYSSASEMESQKAGRLVEVMVLLEPENPDVLYLHTYYSLLANDGFQAEQSALKAWELGDVKALALLPKAWNLQAKKDLELTPKYLDEFMKYRKSSSAMVHYLIHYAMQLEKSEGIALLKQVFDGLDTNAFLAKKGVKEMFEMALEYFELTEHDVF